MTSLINDFGKTTTLRNVLVGLGASPAFLDNIAEHLRRPLGGPAVKIKLTAPAVPLTLNHARLLAEHALLELNEDGTLDLTMVDEMTETTADGWKFYYASRPYLKSREPLPNPPITVNRNSRSVQVR